MKRNTPEFAKLFIPSLKPVVLSLKQVLYLTINAVYGVNTAHANKKHEKDTLNELDHFKLSNPLNIVYAASYFIWLGITAAIHRADGAIRNVEFNADRSYLAAGLTYALTLPFKAIIAPYRMIGDGLRGLFSKIQSKKSEDIELLNSKDKIAPSKIQGRAADNKKTTSLANVHATQFNTRKSTSPEEIQSALEEGKGNQWKP